MPSIKKAIAALEQQQKLWSRRSSVVWWLEENYNDLREAIASFRAEDHTEEERKAKEATEAAHAAYERRAAKSREPSVGDRVFCHGSGAGTLLEVVWSVSLGEWTKYYVHFDTGATRAFYRGHLERLLPDEDGYQPPAHPMLEYRNGVPMAPIVLPDTVEVEEGE